MIRSKHRYIFGICAALLIITSTIINAQKEKSAHQIQSEYYKKLYAGKRIEKPIPFFKAAQTNKQTELNKTVFGFLPYWRYLDGSYKNIRYNLLTHISIFSWEADSLGNLTTPYSWPWEDVIFNARSSSVKLIMCVTNFDKMSIKKILSDTSSSNQIIKNIKAVIIRDSLDGVNIDFENLDTLDRGSKLNNFMKSLSDSIKSISVEKEISFDSPAVDWGSWDFLGLANRCDYLFMMGYEYYGNWGDTTGPSSPLTGTPHNLTRSLLQDYACVVQPNPGKIILGIPYYGNHWITRTRFPYTDVLLYDSTSRVDRFFYEDIDSIQTNVEMVWDSLSQTPWLRWQENDTTWHQIWYDDSASIRLKYDLAIKDSLGGVGIWALGFDGSRPELWNLIQNKFGSPTVVEKGNPIPQTFELYQNYPNPFNPKTTIKFSIPTEYSPLLGGVRGGSIHVELKVYTVLGREVTTLLNDEKQPGNYEVKFNGNRLASGVYFYRLTAGKFSITKKMILLK